MRCKPFDVYGKRSFQEETCKRAKVRFVVENVHSTEKKMCLGRDVMVENVYSTKVIHGNLWETFIPLGYKADVYCKREELRICPTQSRICFCEIVMC